MILEKREFEKKVINGESVFHFKFIGNENVKNIDYERVNKLIDDSFNKIKTYNDMIRNVAWIRTILKDFEESYLEVHNFNSENDYKSIRYINKKLISYVSKNIINDDVENTFYFEFKTGKGLNVIFSDDNQILEYPYFKIPSELIANESDKIYNLSHINPIILNRDSEILCEIYRLFYNENPDFSLKDINIKIQTMMSILNEFGISLGDNYTFNRYSRIKMPISIELENLVDKLTPLGEIVPIHKIEINNEDKIVIKIVGKYIREFINHRYSKYDNNEMLIVLSSIIYAVRYNLPSKANVKDISSYTNYSSNEVEMSMKLIKNIHKNILDNL